LKIDYFTLSAWALDVKLAAVEDLGPSGLRRRPSQAHR
jgi:hypothetical protein